jgi:hypothetical protein
MAPGLMGGEWKDNSTGALIHPRIADEVGVKSVLDFMSAAKLRLFSLLAAAVFCLVPSLRAGELTLPSLEVGGQTYSNVVVTSRTSQYVIIQHTRGITTLKPKDLKPEVLLELGYHTNPVPPKAQSYLAQKVALDPKIKEMEEKTVEEVKGKFHDLAPMVIQGIVAGLVLFHFFFSYCSMLICKKAGHEPGVLVWIPGLQIYPLVKAAGLSGWWILLLFVPVVSAFAAIYWCIKICQARGKSSWLGLLLLLPVTSFFTYLYLAFADGSDGEPETGDQRISLSRTP